MIKPVQIGNRLVGLGQPCFIIAEAGVNHNGDIELAKRLIEEAKAAGADAIKFQTYSTESVIVKDAPKASYQLRTTDTSESQFAMLERLCLTRDEFAVLKNHADRVGITFFSTPSDRSDVDFLISIQVPVIKVASMDLVNYPLLDYIGKQNLPVILSTGMATLGEVEAGLIGLLETGCSEIILLHCVTGYPVRHEDANLRVIETLSNAFQRPVGFSDHTLGIITPIAAFVLGAVAVEKHFTLNTQMPGPDHAVSLDPVGFKAMVEGIRVAENALGNPVKKPLPVEIENRRTMRRSITTLIDLPAGTELKQEHLVLKRPGGSLGAEFMNLLVGRRLGKTIPKDTQLTLEDVIGADVK